MTELETLERRLAYTAARSDIECYCITVTGEPGCWYDTRLVLDDGRETVAIATRYLDLRGLIERHPSQPWMRVREEA